MPAGSKKQQMAAGAALAAKRNKTGALCPGNWFSGEGLFFIGRTQSGAPGGYQSYLFRHLLSKRRFGGLGCRVAVVRCMRPGLPP